jgi:NAD(P)-dependent dehydrogenase (short-subunit alcohol dehydrogenase family)
LTVVQPTVLITGTSSGLGRCSAVLFAQQGWTVYATARSPASIADLAGPVGAGRIHVLPLDVCDDESVTAAFRAAAATAGAPDTVVHNAGVELVGPVESFSPNDLRWQLETNVVGALRLARVAVPPMRARGTGRMIFVSSVVGRFARPQLGAYCASKFALEGLAESLYLETREFGIAVSLLEPGRFPSTLRHNARRTVWSGPGEDPYTRARDALPEAIARLEPAGYEPSTQAMAEALLGLATIADPPLRQLVGADAISTDQLVSREGYDGYAAVFDR